MNRGTFGFLLLFSAFLTQAASSLMTAIESPYPAAQLQLPNLQGKVVDLSDYQGKYVLVNFWAYWCAPCIKEFPALDKLHRQLQPQGLEVLAIHAGPFEQQAKAFLVKHPVAFEILVDAQTSLKGWQVRALPLTYLISPDGQVIYKALGERTWEVEAMKPLLSAD